MLEIDLDRGSGWLVVVVLLLWAIVVIVMGGEEGKDQVGGVETKECVNHK